tara:strand:+ start:449 stop:751 length:303 start_codon:yes stop_codon:yes gene_type:complete
MWYNIGKKDDFSNGNQWLVEAKGRPIGLFRYNEQYYAIKNSCTHQGFPLNEGKLCNYMIECELHGWVFDIRDGKCLSVPDRETTVYKLREIDGCLEVFVE